MFAFAVQYGLHSWRCLFKYPSCRFVPAFFGNLFSGSKKIFRPSISLPLPQACLPGEKGAGFFSEKERQELSAISKVFYHNSRIPTSQDHFLPRIPLVEEKM